jgi:hypothetical protein
MLCIVNMVTMIVVGVNLGMLMTVNKSFIIFTFLILIIIGNLG